MPIFPLPLAKFKLERSLTKQEKEIIKKEKTNSFNFVEQTTNKFILDLDGLGDIKSFVSDCIENFRKDVLLAADETNFELTQSWVNFFNSNSLHAHTHPNSLISGVLYVSANIKEDRLLFFKHQNHQIQINTTEYNLFNSDSWSIPVATGDCILFPSDLPHAVDSSDNKDRVSLAFNAFPRGTLGFSDSTNFIDLSR